MLGPIVYCCLAMSRLMKCSMADFSASPRLAVDKALDVALDIDEPLVSQQEANDAYDSVSVIARSMSSNDVPVIAEELEMFQLFRQWRWGEARRYAYMQIMLVQAVEVSSAASENVTGRVQAQQHADI